MKVMDATVQPFGICEVIATLERERDEAIECIRGTTDTNKMTFAAGQVQAYQRAIVQLKEISWLTS